MKKSFLIFNLLFLPTISFAITEKVFKWCVDLKDLSIAVAKQADRCVERDAVRSILKGPRVLKLFYFVCDFHSVKKTRKFPLIKWKVAINILIKPRKEIIESKWLHLN